MKDINLEAKRIITEHTTAVMSSAHYEFESNEDLWEFMLNECGYILTEDFLNGKYTPQEYNDIRNEVAKILNGIFAPVCYK